jgi:SanA protein
LIKIKNEDELKKLQFYKEKSKQFITAKIDSVYQTKVGLLLGTSRFLKSGYKNEYFFNRIQATVELFNAKKIKYVIVSGDNSRKDYNEPLDMKNELMKNGIPDSLIYLDYAGLRTLDSVLRAKIIFGQNEFIIISQKFHNERAVFIARQNAIAAFGYNAKDVVKMSGLKTKIREYFARVKVFIDDFLNVKPKYLGNKIKIQ